MHIDYIKTALNLLAAAAAVVAALSWHAAAGYPVAKLIPAFYGVTTTDMKPHNDRIERGAKLNARAAAWASISALCQALQLIISIFD